MQFYIIRFFSLIIFTSLFSISFAQKSSLKTVIIDPGHGGFDPGALGSVTTEAKICLDVSLKFGKALQKEFPELKIIYTRTKDEMAGKKASKDEGIKYRANLANENNGDLFISIHCNSAGRKPGGWYEKRKTGYNTVTKRIKVKKKWVTRQVQVPIYENVWVENKAAGSETYIWAADKIDDKVHALDHSKEIFGEIDSSSTLELPDPKEPAEIARKILYAKHYFKKSYAFADYVQLEFENAGRINRGVKQRNDKGIFVLQATSMPSILIELGFVSNIDEEAYLNSEEGQTEIVNNLIAAYKNYKQSIERKNNTDATTQQKGL